MNMLKDSRAGEVGYKGIQTIDNISFICGFCSHKVASDRGFKIGFSKDGSGLQNGGIYVCPNCNGPTFAAPNGNKYPSPAFGEPVPNVPADLSALYEEARRSTSANCHTGAVLLCRKLLMNIAVAHGAAEGLKFIEYVEHLSTVGYVPPNGKPWVDKIRTKGNEATHEVALMTEAESKDLLRFTEMLLRFIYEFPAMI